MLGFELMSWSAADVTLLVVHYDTLHEMKWLNLASRCPLSFTDPHDTPYVKQIVLKSCSLNWALLEVWTYTGLTVRLRFHVVDSVQFDITMHWRCTAFSIFNFTSHVYNFVNIYKQSDIWTVPLILPAQRKHASWMYQTNSSLGTEDNRSI